jgi:putative transposase
VGIDEVDRMAFHRPYTKLFCHLVWATWDRVPLITPEHEPRLHSMIRAKLRELNCAPIATGGVEDHVHILCRYPPTLCVSELVRRIKGASSHFMNDQLMEANEFTWQGTYGAFSIHERGVPKVKAYILNQRAHHSRGELQADWEHVWIPDGYDEEALEY